MTEQEKRALMLKAVVKFKGKWPDEEEPILYKFCYGDFVTGLAGGNANVVCTKQEFEDFVESLFDGAPDDAEYYLHREDSYDFWKSVAGGYLHWNEVTQEWVGQVCSLSQVESELIRRPRKQKQEKAEWSGEGLPPVGTKCEIQTDDLSDFYQVTIQAYSNDGKVVLIYDDFDNNCEYDYWFIDDTKFRPLKTESEKELDQLIIDGVNTVKYYSGLANPTLESAIRILVQSGWRLTK